MKSSASLPCFCGRPLLLACVLAWSAAHAAPELPRVLPPASYAVQPGELVDLDALIDGPAGLSAGEARQKAGRPQGRAYVPRQDQILKFAPQQLVPGRTYVLKVRTDVRGGKSEPPVIAVRFRNRSKSEIYRSYRLVLPQGAAEKELSFTAPPFADLAELAVAPKGNDLKVEQLSLRMREPVNLTEPITSTEGSHVLPGYALVFNDEFNGNELNRVKWFTRYIYEGGNLDTLKSEKQRFRDNDNHVLKDGVLSLVARKGDKPGQYESGMIRSDWTTRYGYFEARVKMPGGKGVFPAFWLNSDVDEDGQLEWPPEIDIFEFVHNGGEEKRNMIHTAVVQQRGTKRDFRYVAPGFDRKWTYWTAPYNFDEGWHTIGAEWTPDSVTTYLDGRKLVTFGYEWKYQNGKLAGPAHVLLNLSIGGDWAGKYGIDDNAFPQALQIDWVRVYKKPQ